MQMWGLVGTRQTTASGQLARQSYTMQAFLKKLSRKELAICHCLGFDNMSVLITTNSWLYHEYSPLLRTLCIQNRLLYHEYSSLVRTLCIQDGLLYYKYSQRRLLEHQWHAHQRSV